MAKNKSKKSVEKVVRGASKSKHFLVVACVFLLISLVAFLGIFFFGDKLVNAINKKANYDNIDFSVGLKMNVIDVNQGDAIFIELPDNKTMLIDSGDNRHSDDTKKFKDYLENAFEGKDRVLDYCILTHPDSDHGGNMAWVFDYFEVKNAYRPNVYATDVEESAENARPKNDLFYKNYVTKMLSEEDCKIFVNTAGLTISGEDYLFTFYGPNKNRYTDWNNYSPIIVLEYFDVKICLTGDAETEAEKEILNLDDFPKCQILKAGHHGSNTSSSTNFLNKVQPKYVLVSVGKGNSYGHPGKDFVNRINNCPSVEKVFYTSEIGTISLFLNEDLASKGNVYFYSGENGITVQTIYVYTFSGIGGLFVLTLVVVNVFENGKKGKSKKSR